MARNLRVGFEEAASEYPDKIIIKYKEDTEWTGVSYNDFRDRARSLSAFLLEEKVEKNDKIAVLMENRPEWPLVFFAVVSAGAVSVPVDPGSAAEEIENILKDSECRFAFVGESSVALMEEMRRRCPSIEKVISVDSDAFKDAASRPSERAVDVEIDAGDPACILYTSGTTAEPKGVVLSHNNLLANCGSIHKSGMITQKDTVVSVLPLHHAYPLTATMILPLLYGGGIIYPGSMRGEVLMEAMREAGATVFVAVPQIFYSFYQKITETIKKIPFPFSLLFRSAVGFLYRIRERTGMNLARYFLYGIHRKFGRSMRVFISGGAKLDEDVEEALLRFGFTILEGYGLTETSPVLTYSPFKRPKIGSVGVPVPDVELKIADKNEEGIGEVMARGPNIMEGYYRREALTAQVIKDGWLHTGDLGYIDEDGYL
ncbi:MAG: AMP-binding protein, partial [Candidatus Omnitrophica bacterium]|nr:AMP-binding protein [Candidatus Omnitrophota bacterium]